VATVQSSADSFETFGDSVSVETVVGYVDAGRVCGFARHGVALAKNELRLLHASATANSTVITVITDAGASNFAQNHPGPFIFS
jgi:hypothetical protein